MDTPDLGQMSKTQVSETTWLEGIVEVQFRKMPDGMVILSYILRNGHRYTIPLNGQALELTRRGISPVTVAGVDSIPRNGHGAP